MTVAQTLAVTGVVTLANTVEAAAFHVGGQKVVGMQEGPIADANSSNKINIINQILAALRTHGLIGAM